uniref:Uncharacterized protein n=1 Tax=Steinernema glaseri TaxID=37863 RepID=A0A1I7Z9S8_9BILA
MSECFSPLLCVTHVYRKGLPSESPSRRFMGLRRCEGATSPPGRRAFPADFTSPGGDAPLKEEDRSMDKWTARTLRNVEDLDEGC